MPSKTFDRYMSVILIGVGTFFIAQSLQISASTYGSSVGPDIFPKVLGSVLIILSILLFFQTTTYKNKNEEKESLDYIKFMKTLGITLLYALTLEWIGYIISTFIFLVVGFQIMKRGKMLNSILISGVLTVVVYYVYVEVLSGTLQGFPKWLVF
ncbi:tripartite tricarboxylate transporter TctB family protein [Bacillus sp. JJ1533]|uniref:tripartite tricarboxylate transporter TctB family protein n=1 Tax=Bacillus sp. JJ1533 TaxID=3122959 RepID=UPI003000E1A6